MSCELPLGRILWCGLPSFQMCGENGDAIPIRQVRTGMGAYAGAARRRVHRATVLLRPPSDHRPGKRQARHAHIPQKGLNLTQTLNLWTCPRYGPTTRISTRKHPNGGILDAWMHCNPRECVCQLASGWYTNPVGSIASDVLCV